MSTADAKTEYLGGTEFTINWLEMQLKLSAGVKAQDAKVDCFDAERIGVGQGYMSFIVRVRLQWSGNCKDKLPNSVVIKVPTSETIKTEFMNDFVESSTMTEEEVNDMMENTWMPLAHANECIVYEMFKDNPPILMPKIYHVDTKYNSKSQQGVLVMQDFCTLNGETVNMVSGFNMAMLTQIIDNLASMHAWSIKHQGTWESKLRLYPKKEMETWPEFMIGTWKMLSELDATKFPLDQDNQIMWASDPDACYDLIFAYKSQLTGVPPVLVLGDMWANNLLFQKGTDKLLALIDFQIAHPGNPVEDLCRVLFTSTNGDLRRKETTNLLKYFYGRLTNELGTNPPFSVEALQQCYEYAAPFGCLFYIMMVPVMVRSKVVEGPNKDKNVEELLMRAKMAIDDIQPYKKLWQNVPKTT